MAEYINRVDLVLKLDWDNDIGKWTLREDDLDDITTITDVPTVVRCKDCDYYEGDECVCPYIWMSDGAHMWMNPDDFCSYGERKEEPNGTD